MDFSEIEIDTRWNTGDEKELKLHSIHAYPAKFPAFITSKTIELIESATGKKPQSMADVFCGCGTTAIEAKRNQIRYWGCDLNPVATLIARTKSSTYCIATLEKMNKSIRDMFCSSEYSLSYETANDRIRYWFLEEQFLDLARLKHAIDYVTESQDDYRNFFYCAFSNILKATSLWLTKSIKPQRDMTKTPANVLKSYDKQIEKMIAAQIEFQNISPENKQYTNEDLEIVTGNILHSTTNPPMVDVVITSPPYVTSYEYADLHQLSTLWLGFTNDYRQLRSGSIGSSHNEDSLLKVFPKLYPTGFSTVSTLYSQSKSRAASVANYFLDMQNVAQKVFNMLNPDGSAVFVIGNTEYKGIKINNAEHLAESLLKSGFSTIQTTKRKISNKNLTPFRDANGKFSSDESGGKKIYAEEYIVIGRKGIRNV